jgi:hypothetical protein
MLIEKLEYIESTGSRSGLNFGGASRRFRLPGSRFPAPGIDSMSRVILAAPPFGAAVCRAGTARTIFPTATVPGHIKTRQPEKKRREYTTIDLSLQGQTLAPGNGRSTGAWNHARGPAQERCRTGEAGRSDLATRAPDYWQSLRVRLGNGIGPGNAKGLQPVGCSPRSTLKSGRTRPEITAS